MSVSTRTARGVGVQQARSAIPMWSDFLTLSWADLMHDLSRLSRVVRHFPFTLELEAHDGRLLLGRLQGLGHDACVPPRVRDAVEDVLAMEFPTLGNFESRILESLTLLDTLDLSPTFTDIALPWDGFDPAQLLGDDFVLSPGCTLTGWASVSDQFRRSNDNHTFSSHAPISAGPQNVRRYGLGPTRIRSEDPQLDGLRTNLLHLRPLLDRLGLAIRPPDRVTAADKSVNRPGQADRLPDADPNREPAGHTLSTAEHAATELTETTHAMIRQVGRAYHASIVRDQPASIEKILSEAAAFLSAPELKLLHEELLAVQLACRLEEYIRETP